MKFLIWISWSLLCFSILLEIADTKSGGGGGGRGGGSYRSSYRSYYDSYNSDSNASGSDIGIGLSVFFGCCAISCCWRFRNKCFNSRREVPYNSAPESEYNAAVIYSIQNPPEVMPPDATGEVRMMVDPNASTQIQNSIHIDHFSKTVTFVDQTGVEDRCIQSNIRIMGYYEVTITKARSQVCIAVGFSSKPYPPFRLPGWERHSVAYHSDNGYKFFNDPVDGIRYGPKYGEGDTIGCGFTNSSSGHQSFFFTHNGQHLGVAFTTDKLVGETYANIGSDGACSISINSGSDSSKPFLCQAINFGIGGQPQTKIRVGIPEPAGIPVGIAVGQPVGLSEERVSAPPPVYESLSNQKPMYPYQPEITGTQGLQPQLPIPYQPKATVPVIIQPVTQPIPYQAPPSHQYPAQSNQYPVPSNQYPVPSNQRPPQSNNLSTLV